MLRRLRHFLAAPPPQQSAPVPPLPAPAAATPDDRIDLAALCRDCDILPKVPDAGTLRTEPDGTRVQTMHNGLLMRADTDRRPWLTELIRRCHGHRDPQRERVLHEILVRMPPDATMIDLGADQGFHALWFLLGHPARRAIAVEPDPTHRASAAANAARNDLTPILVEACAGGTDATAHPFALPDGQTTTVPRRSVPALMQTHGIDTLDLLLCNAHGAELDVLASVTPLLQAGRIRTLVLATHHHSITGDPLTHQRCLAAIEACGGAVIAEHDVHESFTGDGLIAARFGPDQAGWPTIPLSRNRYSTSLFRNPLYDLAEALAR